ncbi:phosphonate ABC transporter, permease protein PhnE [Ectobacillus ponti]|uniref:Phosphonate ABC transporter, permease protein PhnE n=1 Tax=Ectobacillus ponti TaxID=2961894 RepID=A0AA41X265_9BACI|nr:phosphonate ABC transporter, permease protein PhnE [Ectobacillus ponti]MCP8967357.1 phosphonate ABC transporter, permease protein PhnE [Ectobacillus ponti]
MKPPFRSMRRILVCAVLLMALGWSWSGTGFNLLQLLDIGNTFQFVQKDWLPPDWSVLPLALKDLVVTVQIAFLGTTLALLAAGPLSFLAARNTNRTRTSYHIVRVLLSFLRSVPEIVWGLLLVVTLGLGPFPGVAAIMLHNIGVLGKLLSELLEAADEGPPEAVASTGAPHILVLLYGYVPQVLPNILSQYFYRFEVGIRTSLVLGFIGAGGIGNRLFIDFKTFSYSAVAAEVLLIMALVIVVDYAGSLLRGKVI